MCRKLVIDAIEAAKVVASRCIGVLDRPRRLPSVNPARVGESSGASLGRSVTRTLAPRVAPRERGKQRGRRSRRRPARPSPRSPLGSGCGSLQARGLRRKSDGRASMPIALDCGARSDLPQQSAQRRLTLLLVRHIAWRDAALGRRPSDDLIVDVPEAEPVGDEMSDLGAAGSIGSRDANGAASHEATLRLRRWRRQLEEPAAAPRSVLVHRCVSMLRYGSKAMCGQVA